MDQSGDFNQLAALGAFENWALLIDGENVLPDAVNAGLLLLRQYFAVRRVYGDLNELRKRDWTKHLQFRTIHADVGHNSADILLALEAVSLSRAGTRHFVIVTGDGGLVHLVRVLREEGCRVIVMAGPNASLALQVAGQGFIKLDEPGNVPVTLAVEPDFSASILNAQPSQQAKAYVMPLPVTDFDQYVRQEVRRAGHEGLPIATLNTSVTQKLKESIRSRPEKNWRAYFAHVSRAKVFIYHTNGPNASVVLAEFKR